MNIKKSDEFYLATGMFVVLSACVVCGICGKDLIKEVNMLDKIMIFILKLIGMTFFSAVLIYGLIACINNFVADCQKPNKWKLASKIGDCKNCQYVIFDDKVKNFQPPLKNNCYRNLKQAVFYAYRLEIQSRAFSNCEDLEEITFYEIPKSIEKDAFLGCDKLSLIRIYGTKEDWEKLKIYIPSNPKIEFIPPSASEEKAIDKKTIDVNCNATINVKTL